MSRSDADFEQAIADKIASLPGVEAVMLGGSRAYGTPTSTTDWDLGLYYRGTFEPDALSSLGWSGQVFPVGGWGGGVFNGGAWLVVDDERVDVHYRDLEDVEFRIAEAQAGRYAVEHLAFHLAGVPTYIVVAELALGRVLRGSLPVPDYPEALRESARQRWAEAATMTLDYGAASYASHGDVIGVSGSLARAILEAAHGRVADRRVWVTNEKRLVELAGLAPLGKLLEELRSDRESLTRIIEAVRAGLASI